MGLAPADDQPDFDAGKAREFALDIVRRLREAGFQALWAGGCVRDHLLNLRPKDYDVATDATPEQIRNVFGRRRTLAIGQAFGVIVVLGPKSAGQVDVATFRRDATYSDGRHPDRVTFSSAPEDAQRRDFTINGLFFDPIAEQVIDYVGGQQDLARRVIRAIGDPFERFAEDKLRMLRAVRIATVFGFQIEPGTLDAIRQLARQMIIVSAERIAAELRRMLEHAQRRRGIELLVESGLLPVIFPELEEMVDGSTLNQSLAAWQQTLQILERLNRPSSSAALAALLRGLVAEQENGPQRIEPIGQRLRLSNDERAEIAFLIEHETDVRAARRIPWPRLQRVLIQRFSPSLLTYGQAVAEVLDGTTEEVEFCRGKLELPATELDPPPLITGNDLRASGLPPSPVYRQILERVRDAQLEGRIRNRDEALALARQIAAE
ncbi:MAG: CCA tRNA nucleotidyltransferase [Pirellulaceae bacterium]|nr:CCA tRNA nucleotidyltransferase [Pirellulaceae bacterium]